jgi:hypothetical protein
VGDAVEGEPCPPGAADTARHILRRDRGEARLPCLFLSPQPGRRP